MGNGVDGRDTPTVVRNVLRADYSVLKAMVDRDARCWMWLSQACSWFAGEERTRQVQWDRVVFTSTPATRAKFLVLQLAARPLKIRSALEAARLGHGVVLASAIGMWLQSEEGRAAAAVVVVQSAHVTWGHLYPEGPLEEAKARISKL